MIRTKCSAGETPLPYGYIMSLLWGEIIVMSLKTFLKKMNFTRINDFTGVYILIDQVDFVIGEVLSEDDMRILYRDFSVVEQGDTCILTGQCWDQKLYFRLILTFVRKPSRRFQLIDVTKELK